MFTAISRILHEPGKSMAFLAFGHKVNSKKGKKAYLLL
jgi:hypothetical protein